MTSSIEVEVLPAGNGDAVLVRCVGPRIKTNILVDGGPSGTFERCLKPRLESLARAGERLDLVIVTHVDTDHIDGIIELLSQSPPVIEVGEIWHNGYHHLPLGSDEPSADDIQRVKSQSRKVAKSCAQGSNPIGAKEGLMLSVLLREGGYNWNTSVGGGPIMAGQKVDIGEVELQVLGPEKSHFERLLRCWRKELIKMGADEGKVNSLDYEGPFEARLLDLVDEDEPDVVQVSATMSLTPPADKDFRRDPSNTNVSSIVVLISFGGNRLLLLGDSVLGSLGDVTGCADPLQVDCVKVAHHGSIRNTSPDFLRSIRSRCFVFSTDGSGHGHPHIGTLLRISAFHPGCTLAFNYPTERSQIVDDEATVRLLGLGPTLVGDSVRGISLSFGTSND